MDSEIGNEKVNKREGEKKKRGRESESFPEQTTSTA